MAHAQFQEEVFQFPQYIFYVQGKTIHTIDKRLYVCYYVLYIITYYTLLLRNA